MSLTKVSYSMITGSVINVFDYMTAAQIADVTSRAQTLNVYAPLQAALDAATLSGSSGKGCAVFLPAGTYRIGSTLSVPNSTVFYGEGRQQTVIRPTAGFAGVMLTDKGNASKIFLRDFRIEAMGEAGVTDIIKMGYGSQPVGASEWSNLFFSGGVPGVSSLSTCTGINIVTNVFDLCEIEGGYCGTDFKLGPNSTVTTFDRCFSINAVNYAFQLNGNANITNCEIEAPQITCIGVYASRETVISGLTYSAAVSNPYAIEIDAACPLFSMTGFTNFQSGATVLAKVLKDNRSGYPTYWGTPNGTYKNVASIADNNFNGGVAFIQNLQRQVFIFKIENDGGIIKHSFTARYGAGLASSYVNKITGATTTATATPSGTNATTPFAAGAKISSANKSVVIFNTASQTNQENFIGSSPIIYNSSGTNLLALVSINASYNVNGTTSNYLTLQFLDATDSSLPLFDLTALGVGKNITVSIDTYLM